MKIYKSEKNKDRKNTSSFDLENNGKHLMMGLGPLGFLTLGLYYDDSEKDFWFEEEFTIDKSNHHVYKLFDDTFFSYGGETFFSVQGADLTLTKEDEGYRFNFIRNYREDNRILESRFVDDTIENRSMYYFFDKLQEYDPEKHQIHMSELDVPLTLTKNKKNIES